MPMPILRHGKPGGCNSSPSHRWSRSHSGSSQERWQGCSSRQKLTSPMLLPRCFPLLLNFWLSESKRLIPRTSGSGLGPLTLSADPASPRCCPSRPALPLLTSCSLLQSTFHLILAPNTPEPPQLTVPLQQVDFGIGYEPWPFSSPSYKLPDVLPIFILSMTSHWRSQRDPPTTTAQSKVAVFH